MLVARRNSLSETVVNSTSYKSSIAVLVLTFLWQLPVNYYFSKCTNNYHVKSKLYSQLLTFLSNFPAACENFFICQTKIPAFRSSQ